MVPRWHRILIDLLAAAVGAWLVLAGVYVILGGYPALSGWTGAFLILVGLLLTALAAVSWR